MQNSCELPKVRTFDGHDWFSTKIYRRNLPHWELKGSTYFITFCVYEALGKPFRDPRLAQQMVDILKENHKKQYLLQAYVVMPDHVHIIIKPINNYSLASIMKNIKGCSGYQINKLLERQGTFWQRENFDHLIRDQHSMIEKCEYIVNNPVKARMVRSPEEYPFSSVNNDSVL